MESLVTFTCIVCGRTVARTRRYKGRQTCCSRSCAARRGNLLRLRTGRVQVTCTGCGVVFEKWRNDVPRFREHFHTRACRTAYMRANTRDPDRLRDLVWERDRGVCVQCKSTRFLEMHHLNGAHGDNRLANVALYCKKCHVAAHITLRGGILPNGKPSRSYRERARVDEVVVKPDLLAMAEPLELPSTGDVSPPSLQVELFP